jgi:hypothetical protein
MTFPALGQTQPDAYPDSWQARELQACGAPGNRVNFTVLPAANTQPSTTRSADKALIYVIRPRHALTGFQSKIAVDGEWRGVNLAGTYFTLMLEPGLHFICSEAKSRSLLIFTAEAGKTYYVEQQVVFKPHSPVHNLFLLSEADGKSLQELTTLTAWKIE